MTVVRSLAILALASSIAACSLFDQHPTYSGPDDYAYTLNVGCFCPYVGPLRITVQDDAVVDVRQLDPREDQGNVETLINEWARTLAELEAEVDRARREADKVEVEYDPVFGFPTSISIDWIRDAVDDEISYTVSDYTPS
jgi:hypothetical protein